MRGREVEPDKGISWAGRQREAGNRQVWLVLDAVGNRTNRTSTIAGLVIDHPGGYWELKAISSLYNPVDAFFTSFQSKRTTERLYALGGGGVIEEGV